MLGRYALACLIGIACGVANGAYLLLLLHVISVTRGAWRTLLSASWLVLAGWPVPVVMFVVLRPLAANEALCFVYSWVPLSLGAMVWYLHTHPNPLQIGGRRHDQHDGPSPAPACSQTQLSLVEREAVRLPHGHCWFVAAVGCGAGLAFYLLLSRGAFLHYYLAALYCGVGLALYLLILLHAIRVARGRWRGFLRRLWLSAIVLYFATGLAFRVAGTKLGVADDWAAALGIPFLLGAPLIGTAIWYVSKRSSRKSTEPTRDGV
jgi:hypothetical protein